MENIKYKLGSYYKVAYISYLSIPNIYLKYISARAYVHRTLRTILFVTVGGTELLAMQKYLPMSALLVEEIFRVVWVMLASPFTFVSVVTIEKKVFTQLKQLIQNMFYIAWSFEV